MQPRARYSCTIFAYAPKMIRIEDIIYKYTSWRLPRFLVEPLARLLHEHEINELLQRGAHLSPHDFLRYVFSELDVHSRVLFTSSLSANGRYLFVANHPFGALDGMLLSEMLLSRWRDVGVVVNSLLMHVEPLRPLWIPVRKYSRQSTEESVVYHEALGSKRQILTFPAGLCSRWVGGRVADVGWKPRFVRDAERYDRQIVPVFVEGTLSPRFYYIYRLRRALHLSLNVEVLFLVDELFAQRGREVRIVVGEPLDVRSLSGNIVERSQSIRDLVYSLN